MFIGCFIVFALVLLLRRVKLGHEPVGH